MHDEIVVLIVHALLICKEDIIVKILGSIGTVHMIHTCLTANQLNIRVYQHKVS